jgi:ubiquinone/menaquinone biosynthesis C-methylase UbiE
VASVQRSDPAYAGQAIYTRGFLTIYDTLVYGFNSPVLWRCPKRRFLDLYDEHVSAKHLDIGVGTGRLLDECRFPVPAPQITLMDLNRNSLASAARRLARYAPHTHQANVLEPWDLPAQSFDSVGMSHLLHCLPGAIPQKTVAFRYARQALSPGGVLFGASILGERDLHTSLSWLALKASNRKGVLSNAHDTLTDLERALAQTFASHHLEIVGAVALFSAQA